MPQRYKKKLIYAREALKKVIAHTQVERAILKKMWEEPQRDCRQTDNPHAPSCRHYSPEKQP